MSKSQDQVATPPTVSSVKFTSNGAKPLTISAEKAGDKISPPSSATSAALAITPVVASINMTTKSTCAGSNSSSRV